MYTGNNKTALTSQKQIADAMLELIDRQGYAAATVSAVCRRAGVSRQTFYSLFESRENVIAFLLRATCCPRACCAKTLREHCAALSAYIVEHREILTLLARNDLMPLLRGVLMDALTAHPPLPIAETDATYANNFLVAGVVAVAETWVSRGAVESAQALGEILYALLSGKVLEAYDKTESGRAGSPADCLKGEKDL